MRGTRTEASRLLIRWETCVALIEVPTLRKMLCDSRQKHAEYVSWNIPVIYTTLLRAVNDAIAPCKIQRKNNKRFFCNEMLATHEIRNAHPLSWPLWTNDTKQKICMNKSLECPAVTAHRTAHAECPEHWASPPHRHSSNCAGRKKRFSKWRPKKNVLSYRIFDFVINYLFIEYHSADIRATSQSFCKWKNKIISQFPSPCIACNICAGQLGSNSSPQYNNSNDTAYAIILLLICCVCHTDDTNNAERVDRESEWYLSHTANSIRVSCVQTDNQPRFVALLKKKCHANDDDDTQKVQKKKTPRRYVRHDEVVTFGRANVSTCISIDFNHFGWRAVNRLRDIILFNLRFLVWPAALYTRAACSRNRSLLCVVCLTFNER